MGSGRGQVKRVAGVAAQQRASGLETRTITTTRHPQLKTRVRADLSVWQRFVQESGIADEGLAAYYLDGEPVVLGEEDMEKLVEELFRDLVDVGALQMPQNVDVDDVLFMVRPMTPAPGVQLMMSCAKVKDMSGDPRWVVTWQAEDVLNGLVKFSHTFVDALVQDIFEALKNLRFAG